MIKIIDKANNQVHCYNDTLILSLVKDGNDYLVNLKNHSYNDNITIFNANPVLDASQQEYARDLVLDCLDCGIIRVDQIKLSLQNRFQDVIIT